MIPTIVAAQGFIVPLGGSGCNVPEDNAGFVSVSSSEGPGEEFYLALRANGTIVAWGENTWGQCDVPPGYADFVAIAAGGAHSLGLRANGSVVAWGRPDGGACDVPEPNSDFIAISAASGSGMFTEYEPVSIGLKANGSIVMWGAASSGVPSPNIGYRDVTVGTWHHNAAYLTWYFMAINSEGEILYWGYPTEDLRELPEPNRDFVAIEASRHGVLAMRWDGTVEGWGIGGYNPPEPNTNFVAISHTFGTCLGLKFDGTVVAWGLYIQGVPEPNADFIGIEAGIQYGCSYGIRDVVTSVGDPESTRLDQASTNGIPQVAQLDDIYPNPFNPRTTVEYIVNRDARARVAVHDMSGKLVAVLVDQHHNAGHHAVIWDGLDSHRRAMPSGTYVIRLKAEDREQARTVVLIR